MNRPSKKDIKAAVDKLKDKSSNSSSQDQTSSPLPAKKSSQRIRKQGSH